MTDSTVLNVEQAAELLGISKWQLYRRIDRGNLKAIRSRRGTEHYEILKADLDAYIAAGGGDVLDPKDREDDEMLRVGEVARITGFAPETIRRMCYAGRLPYVKGAGIKGQLRVPRGAVTFLMNVPGE